MAVCLFQSYSQTTLQACRVTLSVVFLQLTVGYWHITYFTVCSVLPTPSLMDCVAHKVDILLAVKEGYN